MKRGAGVERTRLDLNYDEREAAVLLLLASLNPSTAPRLPPHRHLLCRLFVTVRTAIFLAPDCARLDDIAQSNEAKVHLCIAELADHLVPETTKTIGESKDKTHCSSLN